MDKKTWVAFVGASALSATAGLAIGSLVWSGIPVVEEHHDDTEHEDEAPAGFVALTASAAAAAGVEITTPLRGGAGELLIPGRAAFAPGAETAVGATLTGVVERVQVAAGTTVGAGAPLVTIRSPEGASLRASADAAQADVEAARAVYRRETRLYQERVTARQDWEAARAATLKAEAQLRATQAQVAAAGSPGSAGRVTIRSPMAGTVTAVAAAPGAVVQTGATVVQLANQNRVELIFEAPASAAPAIKVGSPIRATLAGGDEIGATVTAVSPHPSTGGAQVRARPLGMVPPAGTPVSGRVVTGASDSLLVPSEAVQTVDGRKVVFVFERGGFRAKPVVAGRSSGDRTEIVSGLAGNERIAGRGAFLLKAELSRGEAEHEH